MPGRRKGTKRTRHDTRKWILQALEASGSSEPMSTSEIQKRIGSMSGARIPSYSVYQALRTLVKRKEVAARRRGRELSFTFMGAGKAAPAENAPSVPAAPAGGSIPVAVTSAATLHTIAPGEVTILHVAETHIETATNVHGRLVLERHPRPRRGSVSAPEA